MEQEIWKDIPGFEEKYQASTEGNIRSIDRWIDSAGRKIFIKGRVLHKNIDKCGYSKVMLSMGTRGKRKNCKVSILVAKTFIPNPEKKPCVDHINTIRTDDRISNLRWVTYKENMNNPITKQTLKKTCKGAPSKKVRQLSLEGKEIKVWGSINLAAQKLNLCKGNIIKVCKGHYGCKTTGGFKWEYV